MPALLRVIAAGAVIALTASSAFAQISGTDGEWDYPGRPAISGAPDSLVVFLHGFGSSGADFAPIAEAWSAALPGTAFAHPNAPLPMDRGDGQVGYSWFEFAGREAAPSREAARLTIDAMITEITDSWAIPDDRVVVVGFSQGAGVAVNVATCAGHHGVSMGGVVDTACDAEGGAVGIFMVHNQGDPRVPLDWAEAARAMLEDKGHSVAYRAYPGDRHWPVDAAFNDVTAHVRSLLEAEDSQALGEAALSP